MKETIQIGDIVKYDFVHNAVNLHFCGIGIIIKIDEKSTYKYIIKIIKGTPDFSNDGIDKLYLRDNDIKDM